MWIFTPQGYVSAVAHRTQKHLLMVRARRRAHLVRLFPGYQVHDSPNADYGWRVIVTRREFAERVAGWVLGITYDNFKNSIPDKAYHDACLQVWGAMHRYQKGGFDGVQPVSPRYGDTNPDAWRTSVAPPRVGEVPGGGRAGSRPWPRGTEVLGKDNQLHRKGKKRRRPRPTPLNDDVPPLDGGSDPAAPVRRTQCPRCGDRTCTGVIDPNTCPWAPI